MGSEVKNKGSYNIDLQSAVKHLREKKIISKDKEIAEKMNVGQGTVSNYINGMSRASHNFRKNFEKAFGISLSDFNEEEEDDGTDAKKPGRRDYQAERIRLLEERYIRKLEESEAWLKKIVESNLIDIEGRQMTIQAEIQAVQQWDAQIVSEGDQAKAEAALGHIRALVAGNRERLSKTDKSAALGSLDKG